MLNNFKFKHKNMSSELPKRFPAQQRAFLFRYLELLMGQPLYVFICTILENIKKTHLLDRRIRILNFEKACEWEFIYK